MHTARLATVGAFVAGGILLFGVGLFLIGDRRLLFVDQYEIYSEFGRVTGVQVGTGVRVAGLAAGEVTDVLIPPGPSARFRVRMRIRSDLRQLVRQDSIASIQTDGIVGSAFIQIGGGTEAAPIAEPESTIAGRDPVEIGDLIQKGQETFETISDRVVVLSDEISEAVDALTETVNEANALIGDVEEDVKAVTTTARAVAVNVEELTTGVRGIVSDVRAGQGTLGQLLVKDDLYRSATRAAEQTEQTLANVREASTRVREAIDRFRAEDGPGDRLMADLNDAANSAREVMADLAENTEALKHHWLFRGFFNQRGYFDLNTLTIDEYRRGAVEGNRRAALRVWLEADVLFEPGPGGVRLSEGGRRRLDVAMADLIDYPRDSPLVVEGYATTTAAAERYLLSEARARVVQEHLSRRFRRRAALVGSIPIGLDAEGSPAGDDRWDGVALALFVRRDLLAR